VVAFPAYAYVMPEMFVLACVRKVLFLPTGFLVLNLLNILTLLLSLGILQETLLTEAIYAVFDWKLSR